MPYPGFIENNRLYPAFYKVRMDYPHKKIFDVDKAISTSVLGVMEQIRINKEDRVAVCVGSRGIPGIADMVKAICLSIKGIGAIPYIIPAMGSHGGATAQGQIHVLESLGVTTEYCCAEIISSMDTVQVGEVLDGVPVYFSKDCLDMDHTICINRIKPHTKFKGPVESGIYKMLCVGIGKHDGAQAIHQAALRHGFLPVIQSSGDRVIQNTNFRFAIAVVEDHHDEIMQINALTPENLLDQEAVLLKMAKEHFPILPFNKLDVLVIGQIGKEISGSGMDPNVTGRAYDLMEDDFSGNLNATRIVILDLSEKTAGNGIGLGNADIITENVHRKLDYDKTIINALTSTSLRKAFIPVKLPDDRRAINAAISTTGKKDYNTLRIAIIKDTRHLSEFWISEILIDEILNTKHSEIIDKTTLQFSSDGNLLVPDILS